MRWLPWVYVCLLLGLAKIGLGIWLGSRRGLERTNRAHFLAVYSRHLKFMGAMAFLLAALIAFYVLLGVE